VLMVVVVDTATTIKFDGIVRYIKGDLSVSDPRRLIHVLSAHQQLRIVPMEFCARYLRISGMSADKIVYIDTKLRPFRGSSKEFSDADDTAESGGVVPPTTPSKKRPRVVKSDLPIIVSDDGVGDDQECEVGGAAAMSDYYRFFCEDESVQSVTLHVDMDILLAHLGAAKTSNFLRLTAISQSPESNEITKLLVTSGDAHTTTVSAITPLDIEYDVYNVPAMPNVNYAATMSTESFVSHIRQTTSAADSQVIRIDMAPRAKQMTFEAFGDRGRCQRIIVPTPEAQVKFEINRANPLLGTVQYSHRFHTKPMLLICQVGSVSRYVRVYMTENMPIKLHFRYADLGDTYFYQAPKLSGNVDDSEDAEAKPSQVSEADLGSAC
jgi:hypothetical protein